jgi:DHA1 family inner membrane transport protein
MIVLFRILALSLGSFAVGTGAYVVAGVLVDIAEDLSVPVATSGLLITIFALTFAVASPLLVAATSSVARRRLIVGALILFALANAAAALVPAFSLLLLARVVAALGAAVFTPVASAFAASLASPEMRGRALSVRTIGSTVAFLVGIPIGTVISGYYGWRITFMLVAALATVAALGARALLPDVETSAGGTFLSHLGVVRSGAVVGVLALTVLALMASFVVLTYVRPLLESLTGFGTEGIGLMLAIFGLASIPGTLLGGFAADRWGYRVSMTVMLAVLSASLLSFFLIFAVEASSKVAILATVVTLVAWSIATFAQFPLQQYRLIGVAPQEQNSVLSLNASAIQAGQGMGAGFGALILHYGSLASLGWGGALCALVALVVLGYGRSLSTLQAPHKKRREPY